MSDQARRAAIQARIAQSSRDDVILDEMIRLGFWDAGGDPHAAELTEIMARSKEIRSELSQLNSQNARYLDPEAALKAMHAERKAAALARRKETKLARARARQARAEAWAQRSRDAVWHLGPGVSAALEQGEGKSAPRSLAPGLPALATPAAVASAMGVSTGELRFLAYARPMSRVSHYKRFEITKKSGGKRVISAPMPRLKYAQYWLLDAVLSKLPLHPAAHGFVPGRSILTNARPHVGRDVVANMDLRDFFPTLDDRRVKGLFESLGYGEDVAQVLALIATEPVTDEIEIDGRVTHLARSPRRRLPQGAPCSPAITNLICRRLDARLAGLAAKLGFAYTRYADDLTFSASGEDAKKVGALLRAAQEIVRAEGFEPHPDKTRVMRRGARQEVTGLVVNDRLGAPREAVRRARAALHRAERQGVAGLKFGSGRDALAGLVGFAQFVAMIDPRQGASLVARARALRRGADEGATSMLSRAGLARAGLGAAALRKAAAAGAPPEAMRWRPAERPAPTLDPVLMEAERAAAAKARREAEKEGSRQAKSARSGTSVPPVRGAGTGASGGGGPARAVWGRTATPELGESSAEWARPATPRRSFWSLAVTGWLILMALAVLPFAPWLTALLGYLVYRRLR
jgi:retron-type reverse transcriptase